MRSRREDLVEAALGIRASSEPARSAEEHAPRPQVRRTSGTGSEHFEKTPFTVVCVLKNYGVHLGWETTVSEDATGGYSTNPRQTKHLMTQDISDVTRFMEGAEMLGTGLQVRRVALPKSNDPHVFQEWWEVLVFDDPHLGERPTVASEDRE